MTEMLLYAGANRAATTRLGGYTPLHLAAARGSAAVVRALAQGRRAKRESDLGQRRDARCTSRPRPAASTR